MGRVLRECLYPFNEPLVESEYPGAWLAAYVITNQKARKTQPYQIADLFGCN